jgi:para-nitrobenzyl esterase
MIVSHRRRAEPRRCAALAIIVATLFAAAGAAFAATLPAPQARVAQGELQGTMQGDVAAYLGVPYAAPPTGPNRWRAPRPPSAWRGIRPAQAFGASCAQQVSPNGFGPYTHEYVTQGAVSEDCLFLNVWAPAHVKGRLPVLVWIHGGAFNSGSGSVDIYNGRALAARGVIVVTVNYRLGIFGFFAHPELTAEANGAPPANWGLQDQIAALRWVHDNIAAFGGDPAKVTLAGQSAGAMSVALLLTSPAAHDLFQQAILESGLPSLGPPPALAQGEQSGVSVQRRLGAASLADMRAIPADRLLHVPAQSIPVIDGVLLPGQPAAMVAQGRSVDVPVLVGLVANESPMLARMKGVSAATLQSMVAASFGDASKNFAGFYKGDTDAERLSAAWRMKQDLGRASIYEWAAARLQHGKTPAFVYFYQHPEPGPQSAAWGTFHSSEIPYVFQTLNAAPERGFTDRDRAISQDVSTRWLNLIRSGDPNGAAGGDWPPFTAADPRLMPLGDAEGVEPLLPPEKLQAFLKFISAGGHPKLF